MKKTSLDNIEAGVWLIAIILNWKVSLAALVTIGLLKQFKQLKK